MLNPNDHFLTNDYFQKESAIIEKTLPCNCTEYFKLKLVAKMLFCDSPTGVWYRVDDTYLDFGQNWMWTTIIGQSRDGSEWQALSPREWNRIMRATSKTELAEIVKDIFADEYCPDHK